MPPFAEVEHTADRAFRVWSDTREGLFADAAAALYTLGGVQTKAESAGTRRIFTIRADDAEGLLVQWLNEILFLIEQDRLALEDIRIERLTDAELTVSGAPVGIAAIGTYIKAATYSGLRISHKDEIWEAKLVIDV
jgi:SHS2 domain-containing protein